MRKTIVAVLLLIALVFTLVACGDKKEATVVSLYFGEGSVKEIYDVDEKFGYGDAVLVAVYSDGEEKPIAVTSAMISGFDTSTTGKKVLTATYGGLSVFADYEVIYSVFPAKKILTTARLSIEQSAYATGIGREIALDTGDLAGVKAVSFTVRGNVDLFDSSSVATDIASVWNVKKYYVNAKTAKFILYKSEKVSGRCGLVTIGFAGLRNADIGLSDVTVSDGTNDYALPDVAAV